LNSIFKQSAKNRGQSLTLHITTVLTVDILAH